MLHCPFMCTGTGTAGLNRVFIYTNTVPQTTGSGAHLRLYSNVRAYLDLGFEAELVHIAASPDNSVAGAGMEALRLTRDVAGPPSRSILGRIEYRAGMPGKLACLYYYGCHATVCTQAKKRARQYPGALHQFEGDSHGNAIPFLGRLNAIWGSHEIGSDTVAAVQRISQEEDRRPASAAERRELLFARRFERQIARRSKLVLCITERDREVMRSEWSCPQAEYLPMSAPDEDFLTQRQWLSGGRLSLVHVGALGHLPTYRSLEFLLDCIFPSLSSSLLGRLSLRIVGRLDPDNPKCRRILDLASPYPQVEVLGYVEDLRQVYRESDVQVVLCNEGPGLRTRIIESLACGLPVLSSSTNVSGVPGLRNGENIILADTPEEVANALNLLSDAPRLEALARCGRQTYEAFHSRRVVAATLAECLSKYLSRRANPGIGTHGFAPRD